jgi:hypothetical protein
LSLVKRQMEAEDAKHNLAVEIAVEAGVLKRCVFHTFAFAHGADPKEAYKLGNHKFTAGELHGIFVSRREMTDTIKEVVNDAALECWDCAKLQNEKD